MSKHCKPASDSTTLCVVVPKDMKERVANIRESLGLPRMADAIRKCLEEGATMIERRVMRK